MTIEQAIAMCEATPRLKVSINVLRKTGVHDTTITFSNGSVLTVVADQAFKTVEPNPGPYYPPFIPAPYLPTPYIPKFPPVGLPGPIWYSDRTSEDRAVDVVLHATPFVYPGGWPVTVS